MAYVVYDSTTRLTTGAYPTLAAAQASGATAPDVTVDTTDRELPHNFQPGAWFLDSGDNLVPELDLSTENLVVYRRGIAKAMLKDLEAVDGLAAWATVARGADPTRRAGVYSRWVEMMAIASSIDSNLSNDTLWGWLFAEMSIPGELWYVLFDIGMGSNDQKWEHWLRDVAHTLEDSWTFWNTEGTTLTPNSRGGTERGPMAMVPAADFDWVAYLRDLQ